jgi:hypothetical protein
MPTVWIEDRSSRIARGEATSVTNDGLSVRLAAPAQLTEGDEVAVRLALAQDRPTVATSARVTGIEAGVVSLVFTGPRAGAASSPARARPGPA